MLRESRHVGDALRVRDRSCRRDAAGARIVRGCRDRDGRRVRAHGGTPGGDVAPPRARLGQRARQPPQCAPCRLADREHRRRPRHVSRPVRRAVDVGHRGVRAPGVGLAARIDECRVGGGRRCPCGAGGPSGARPDRDADRAGRRGVASGGGSCRSARGARAGAGVVVGDRRGGGGAPQREADRDPAAGSVAARRGPRGGRADCRGERAPGCSATRSRRGSSGARGAS